MYALSRQQEELADVVYAFQRYLGIILTKKTTTLAEEISFAKSMCICIKCVIPINLPISSK